MSDLRTVKIRQPDGTWVEGPYASLEAGVVFELYESDGSPVNARSHHSPEPPSPGPTRWVAISEKKGDTAGTIDVIALTPHAEYVLDLVTQCGLTVSSVRFVTNPRGAIPLPPATSYRIEVHGAVDDGILDEEDMLGRMLAMGLEPRRTAEHPDGYWWYTLPRSRRLVWDTVVVSPKMLNGPVTWADRLRLSPANGRELLVGELRTAFRAWTETPWWRFPPEYAWVQHAARAYLQGALPPR